MRNPLNRLCRVVAMVGVFTAPFALYSCGGSDESPSVEGTGGTAGAPSDDAGQDASQGDDASDSASPDGTSTDAVGDGADVSQGDDATPDAPVGDAPVDVKPNCELTGSTCTSHSDCCSANCDPDSSICTVPIVPCKAAGAGCAVATECCTTVCQAGACGASVCISDNEPCADNAECCSGTCGGADGGMTCTPLNTSCLTTGNDCAAHGDCCSHYCNNGRCSSAPSFCVQTGDTCADNAQCCTGICTIDTGASLGTCSAITAPGATGCLLAGEVCGAGASGTGDAGLPTCGGECCSRSCAPWGPSGVLICQPPSGCRPTGEACRDDSDCCGSDGMPGGNGSVTCSKTPGEPVGRCDNGSACRPAGAVCKLATSSCNAENNCCAGNVNLDPSVCQQDLLGIPRCTGVGDCADAGSLAGQECATSADCCGLPCLPNQDPNGPAFVCGATCAPAGASCTTDADCCAGIPCSLEPGSTQGICGETPGPDGGVIDSGVADSGVPDGPGPDAPLPLDAGTPDAHVCSLYGQQCSTTADCCNGIPCTNGRCVIPVY